MWIPIDLFSDSDVALQPQALRDAVTTARDVQVEPPFTRGEMEYSLLDLHLAASLSGGLFNLKGDFRRVLTASSLVVFEEARDSADRLVRVGASVRLIVGVTVKSGSFGLSLPAIAAAMELRQAEAFYKVTWSGLDLSKVGASLAKIKQGPEPLSVENFHSLSAALDEVKIAVLTTDGAIVPRSISLDIGDTEFRRLLDDAALARSYALSAVADGWSAREAGEELDGSLRWRQDAIDSYAVIVDPVDDRQKPSQQSIADARSALGRMRLHVD